MKWLFIALILAGCARQTDDFCESNPAQCAHHFTDLECQPDCDSHNVDAGSK